MAKIFTGLTTILCCCRRVCADQLTSVSLCRGMSAVCVYTVQDIDNLFTTSPFKGGGNQEGRSRAVSALQTDLRWKMSRHKMISGTNMAAIFQTMSLKVVRYGHGYGMDQNQIKTYAPFSPQCVPDSTKILLDTLKMIEKTSEMEQWIQPVGDSGPLLFNDHNYTHIYVDSSHRNGNNNHTVLFLSLRE